MSMLKNTALAALLALAPLGAAQAATIVNGGLEGNPNNPFQTLGTNSNAITGWTVSPGTVDWIGNLWQHAEGRNSVDLNGSSQGGIFQTITDLIVGVTYEITFALAGNPQGSPAVKSLDVSIGDDSDSYTFDTTGKTVSNMGWVYETFTFTAGSTSETLAFASTTPECCFGPVVDDISIAAVPLPAAAPLLLAGLGGLAMLRRRRRA